ncbi:MAG TPA: hypothetical protein PLP23_10580 [Panacibacter sp.]|nr:hypothetical protein [Panacibacter sp.]
MILGKKIFAIADIRLTHPALRIERSSAGPDDLKFMMIPKNTIGNVLNVSPAGGTFYFQFKPPKFRDMFTTVEITLWVKREFFGSFFEYKN